MRQTISQDHELKSVLDTSLISLTQDALNNGSPVRLDQSIDNLNRSVGAMLSHEVSRRYGDNGLPDGSIDITFRGHAGQSFGFTLAPGITLRLIGDANDGCGKSLSGGMISVSPEGAFSTG